MDNWEFLKWRRTLGYTQSQLADRLGVNRGTIQNWERGATKVSKMAELACEELTRRRKQEPSFGPVTLLCTDAPLRAKFGQQAAVLRCATFPNNGEAFKEAAQWIGNSQSLWAIIIDSHGAAVWAGEDVFRECERHEHRFVSHESGK